MEEVWKDIEGYEGRYQVSNCGRIRSFLTKGVRNNVEIYDENYHIMKPVHNIFGYCVVRLYKNDGGKAFAVHRLVARAFIPNPNNLPQVNHIDGNKQNNNSNNLEWVTAKENIAHSFSTGLHMEGSDHPITIIHKEKLHEVVGLREFGLSFREIGEQFGVEKSTAAYICRNKTYLKYYGEEEFKAKVAAFVEKNKKKFYRKGRRTLNTNGVPSRKVIQKDKNGIVVGEYESITLAAQVNGVLYTSIVNNLKGRSKYCGGYKYEYK